VDDYYDMIDPGEHAIQILEIRASRQATRQTSRWIEPRWE
jgi:hypothetical protein